ncbi:MAG: response regulator [Defluviitaleaceae bacterium]|nr:response regulator [Defluviitaleaceae bacterium]
MSDKIKVFIVDDNKMGQVMLAKMLKESSDQIDIVGESSTASGAIFMLEDDMPDIIMVKLNIPGDMSSVDALVQIRKSCPDTYIVLCPMPQDRAELDDYISSGKADNFLAKPIQKPDINRLLTGYIERRGQK